jgi:serine/threonine-protein kinase RsbW/sigma-B regulation protein RsbU (phosphoserine phosphatase)
VNSRVTRRFTARQAEFDAIRAFIETACAGIEEDERQRAVLLVEELFANSVFHGYGGDSDEPVWLTVEVDTDGCRLTYEDCAPAYNPFAIEEPDLDAAVPEDRPIGGLGIVFLNELSSARSYAREGDRNVIAMHVRRTVSQ